MENRFNKILTFSGWLNIAGGLLCILYFRKFFNLFYNIQYNSSLHGPLLLNHILIFAFIVIIGFGLIKAASNIKQGKLLVQISAYGKLYAALTFIVSVFKDHYSYLFFIPAFIDGALGIYFLISLNRLKLNE